MTIDLREYMLFITTKIEEAAVKGDRVEAKRLWLLLADVANEQVGKLERMGPC